MIAVDTNVWVRFVTNDNGEQTKRALDLLKSSEAILIPKTVLLEMEWVLRSAYGLPARSIEVAMLNILGLPNVHAEAPEDIVNALDYYREGMDFADALHLAGSGSIDAFYTFDDKFIKVAKKLGCNVVTP
jgi:predicted nucleic-acid-binding protein